MWEFFYSCELDESIFSFRGVVDGNSSTFFLTYTRKQWRSCLCGIWFWWAPIAFGSQIGSWLKSCSHRRCNHLATASRLRKVKIGDRLQRWQKGFAVFADHSATSCRVSPTRSVTSCSLNMHKRWLRLILVATRFLLSRSGRDWSTTDPRLK